MRTPILWIATVVTAGLGTGPGCGVADDGLDPASDRVDGPIVPATADGPGGAGFPAGVYSLSATDHPADAGVYANPDVAGIAVRAAWATLEPAPGEYDWTFIDGEVAAAAAAGKRISVYLAAAAPPWLFDLGVPTFTYLDQNPNHGTYGDPITIAVPFDPTFLARWTALVRAFGARYAHETTIAYVRGASESMTNGWGMPVEDVDGASWDAYGYTTARMQAALQRVLDTFMTALPTTAEWVEVGKLKFEADMTAVAEQLAAYGFATYPDRFAVWREDLSGCTEAPPTSEVWQLLWDHPGRDGAQMVWNVQDGPDRMNNCELIVPNDKPTVLGAAIKNGIAYGMPYVEVYQVDVLDPSLAAVLHLAHERLR